MWSFTCSAALGVATLSYLSLCVQCGQFRKFPWWLHRKEGVAQGSAVLPLPSSAIFGLIAEWRFWANLRDRDEEWLGRRLCHVNCLRTEAHSGIIGVGMDESTLRIFEVSKSYNTWYRVLNAKPNLKIRQRTRLLTQSGVFFTQSTFTLTTCSLVTPYTVNFPPCSTLVQVLFWLLIDCGNSY